MKNEIKKQLEKLWTTIENYADELGAEEWEVMEEAYNELETMVLKPMSHQDIIRALEDDCETIAWKVWCYEDIVNFLNEEACSGDRERLAKYGITPEDIALNGDMYWKSLGDCTDYDWEIIGSGIYQVSEQLIKDKIKEQEVES